MNKKRTECFKIQILKTENEDFLDIRNCTPIHQILCDHINIFSEPIMIVADPFLFVYRDKLFLFYEQKKLYHDGVIMMTSTMDLTVWTSPVRVLQENFHLSYPWIFEDNGHIYMIPETCNDSSIRLYEADNDQLTSFRFVKKLIVQPADENITMGFSDTSIYKKNGIYFLHTTLGVKNINQSRLYYADDLFGTWVEHDMSPIVTSVKYGRNAGCLIEYRGMLLRPAQDCELRYGDNVHLLKIDNMTKEDYQESLYRENIIDSKIKFYKEGGHQFNYVKFKGSYIIATDAKEYHCFLWNKILHKLGFYK